ncbi:polysaccharide biosynthesis/export family protein [Parvibaculum sp.]|uniref:polysaccharide biosynthesis/export family protein n=1 Tax=Parvibaculum sp. TaxID=2024848 RepID=UPI001DD5069F|nr:polysaccharide biosynthesis/export family protein [Parvibaculum sp.]MBX3489224.1 polysaccharide export protein [Parvibaculum sp.]
MGGPTRARRWVLAAAALLGALALSACADGPRPNIQGPVPSSATTSGANLPTDANLDYRLGSGDKLRVIVYGEPDLSGEFDVSGTGRVALPLIGQINATSLTLHDFERAVEAKLREGYLTDPRVSAEVLNYRPFYIMGEVMKPGEYPYTSGMTVLNAIAVAGGYTYRADNSRVFVARERSLGEQQVRQLETAPVQPGDVIRIPERFF